MEGTSQIKQDENPKMPVFSKLQILGRSFGKLSVMGIPESVSA